MARRERLVTGGALVLAVGALMAASAWACSPGPALTIAPQAAPAGSHVTVTGTGFVDGQPVEIHWNGRSGPLVGDATGPQFSTEITVPPSAPGLFLVTAVTPSPSDGAEYRSTFAFEVTSPPVTTTTTVPELTTTTTPAPAVVSAESVEYQPPVGDAPSPANADAGIPPSGGAGIGAAPVATKTSGGATSPVARTGAHAPQVGGAVPVVAPVPSPAAVGAAAVAVPVQAVSPVAGLEPASPVVVDRDRAAGAHAGPARLVAAERDGGHPLAVGAVVLLALLAGTGGGVVARRARRHP
ncbi:MAG TPA: hypothetical protein VHM89_05895 [Acidimicrobiales bacterium]|nr:hypothetical protein [Acidimicrobiales bacterium]